MGHFVLRLFKTLDEKKRSSEKEFAEKAEEFEIGNVEYEI